MVSDGHYKPKGGARRARALRAALALSAGLILAACDHTQETRLANGLRVVIHRDDRAPVVVCQVWYQVGSVDEPRRLTGISHALEHMMFKGTPANPAGVFLRKISALGGDANAETGTDQTEYYEEVPKNGLATVLALEADRMAHLSVQDSEFAKEIQVVMDERRMRTDDNPDAIASERFMATAYRVSPYGIPVIGWMRHIKQLTAADVRAWYRKWYAPNNAVVVVVGDVDPGPTLALIRKDFGSIPARALPPRTVAEEPAQHHERVVDVRIPAKVPLLLMGYHAPLLTPGSASRDPYALTVLSGLLAGQGSSRLNEELVRHQQIAVTIDSDYSGFGRYPGLFTIEAVPAPGVSFARLEKAILAAIVRLQETPVPTDDLVRVRRQVEAAQVFSRDSMSGEADQLGTLASLHFPLTLAKVYPTRLEAVTAGDIERVARRYLIPSNLTIATLHPLPMAGETRPAVPEIAHGPIH